MKKHSLRYCLTALLLIVTLLCSPCLTFAMEKNGQVLTDLTACDGWPAAPEIASEGAILIDARTGAILYGKNDDVQLWPASITKLMTGLLTFENCNLDDTVTFSYRATHELEAGATSIARTEGEEMSVQDCLYALLFMSANEVAQGLAEHVGGTIEDFADMMNARAKELGCTATHFVTPSGLHDDAHVTTCRDMAIIMRALIQEPAFLEMETKDYYYIPPTNKHDVETAIAQKHALVHSGSRHYEGAVAGKTGYTVTAGHSLVTYAVRGDVELICVVMQSTATHYEDTRKLLDYGFKNFSAVQLSEAAGAVDFARSTLLSSAEFSQEDLQHTFLSREDWLIVPKNISLTALTGKAQLVSDAAETEEGVPLAAIDFYLGKTKIGTATLMNPTELPVETESPALPETELSPETESAVEETETSEEPAFEGNFKEMILHYINAFLLALGTAMHDLAVLVWGFLRKVLDPDHLLALYRRYGLKLFAAIAAGIAALVLLIRLLIRRHKKKKNNPYVVPKNRTNQGPHMPKRSRWKK